MTPRNDNSIRNQRRRHARFPLGYPLRLKFKFDGKRHEIEGTSNNVSQDGVLLEAVSPVPPNCKVEFVMTIQSSRTHAPIRLKGTGQVVRLEQDFTGKAFGIAISCKRPIYWIE